MDRALTVNGLISAVSANHRAWRDPPALGGGDHVTSAHLKILVGRRILRLAAPPKVFYHPINANASQSLVVRVCDVRLHLQRTDRQTGPLRDREWLRETIRDLFKISNRAPMREMRT